MSGRRSCARECTARPRSRGPRAAARVAQYRTAIEGERAPELPAAGSREERLALDAYRALSRVTETGGATVLEIPEAPGSPMLNRIVGLGCERPATEADVDEALAALSPGVTFYAALAPGARPRELADWLRSRGLEPGWGWMLFRRDAAEPPPAETRLRVVEVETPADAAVFARVARASYGLGERVEAAILRAWEGGWRCWLALDGDEPVGAGGLYVAGGAAYLGLGGTLPEHRRKGAQSALFAARIRCAAGLGCDLVVTETGERLPDRPSASYRNILRAGFEEIAVTANWLGRT